MKKRIISISLSVFVILSISSSVHNLFAPTVAYSQGVSHIVISEIQIAGNTAGDEFVELYNPSGTNVDLTGWRLRRKTATGTTETNLVSSIEGTIPAHGYFLIAPNEYEGSITRDQAYSTTTRLTANNTVYLYEFDGENYSLVDKVGMGETDDSETTSAPSPETSISIERKASESSTEQSMMDGNDKYSGNSEDSDNNSNDFIVRSAPEPQNTNSSGEDPNNTVTPTPSIQPNEPTPTESPSNSNSEKILISEIQIAGNSTTDEFVELYNPNETEVIMDGWRLTRETATGSESNLVSNLSGTLPGYGYFLIAHANYEGSIVADINYSASSNSISTDNTVILYRDAGETLVDKVGMGEAIDNETLTTQSPETSQSIERKASSTSTAESMSEGGSDEVKGNGYDTDNNNADFVIRQSSNPQNSTSNSEINLETNPTPTPTPTNTSEPTPTSNITPTTTLAPTPTETQVPTPTPFTQTYEKVIGIFPLSRIICKITYNLRSFGFFKIYLPSISCNRV